MGVLHVVDGVVLRAGARQLEVEVERRVVAALQHEEAGRVGADVVDQLVEAHELALALRHPCPLAPLHHVHQLHDRRLEAIGVAAERGDRRLHPRHVAVVVGAQRVDQALGAALELVAVVRDVAGEVGGGAVGAHQHAVLVVSKLGGPQPDRSLAVVYVAVLAQLGDRRLDQAGLVQRPLGEPAVESHPEAVERGRDPHPHRLGAAAGKVVEVVRVGARGGELGGELGHVLAGVAVLGWVAPAHAGGDRLGEAPHLASGVVDVVLALDRVAGQVQGPGQRVAERGAPATRRGERAGRVRRDELHQHPLRRLGDARPEALLRVQDRRHRTAIPGIGQEHVQEPRARDLDPLGAGAKLPAQAVPEALGDLPWRLAGDGRDQHRGVGRVVAKLRLRGPFQGWRDVAGATVSQRVGGGADRRPQLAQGVGHAAMVMTATRPAS